MIAFFLACVPPKASHHAKHIVRIGKFHRLADDKELVQAKRQLDALMLPFRVARPMQGPLRLSLDFTWPWRTADSKRVRAQGRSPKFTRPDCSNLAKTTEDRLVAMGFLEDDGQVVELIVRKWVGDRPGIQVSIAPYFDATLPMGESADAATV